VSAVDGLNFKSTLEVPLQLNNNELGNSKNCDKTVSQRIASVFKRTKPVEAKLDSTGSYVPPSMG
jgi:hypothetical protein